LERSQAVRAAIPAVILTMVGAGAVECCKSADGCAALQRKK
jgi:hypothetical protein